MSSYVAGDQINQYGSGNIGKFVAAPREPAGPPVPKTLLVLKSSPRDSIPLRLDDELREIGQAIRASPNRDQLELCDAPAVRYSDLQTLMLRHRPIAVHFSGHGSGEGGIVLADHRGFEMLVPPGALSDLFRLLGTQVRCVVLNACLTAGQATAIAAHVPCVVGMSWEIPDRVAIDFAAGFYNAVAHGQSVAAAVELGRHQVALSGRGGGDAPVLIAADGVAEQTFLTT